MKIFGIEFGRNEEIIKKQKILDIDNSLEELKEQKIDMTNKLRCDHTHIISVKNNDFISID